MQYVCWRYHCFFQWVQQCVNTAIIRVSIQCMCLFTHAKAVFSCVLSQFCGGGVSDCTSSNNKHCWQEKRPALQTALWPLAPTTTSLFSAVQKSSLTFVVQTSHTYSHTDQHPKRPYIISNLFHLCPDANDKLILRTNSIITNNPRSWQAHKKALDEWVVYLLGCMQCRVQAWPAKMPLHYETTEQSAAQPAPVTSHTEEIGY